MPFRERIKKVLRKSNSPNSSQSKTSSPNPSKNGDQNWPSNVYAPGEAMPRPKYRAPVKKEHKDKLDSFSWGDAWRRRSFVSEYSPMGSRAPSRPGSLRSRHSFGAKSRRSVVGPDAAAARATRLSTEVEQEGDDDVANVGLSRVQSREKEELPPLPQQLSREGAGAKTNREALHQPLNAAMAHDHKPFTEEELAIAMHRSHLTVPGH